MLYIQYKHEFFEVHDVTLNTDPSVPSAGRTTVGIARYAQTAQFSHGGGPLPRLGGVQRQGGRARLDGRPTPQQGASCHVQHAF